VTSRQEIIQQAAEWVARIEGGELSNTEQQKLLLWREQSQEHERAWDAALQLKHMFDSVPTDLSKRVLSRKRVDRRLVLKSFIGLSFAVSTGWFTYTKLPWPVFFADYTTVAGEQKSVVLPDGTQLKLNTSTAVSIAFSDSVRKIQLHTGEILVQTTHHLPADDRPFVVNASQGNIHALGTRFSVYEKKLGNYSEIQVQVFEDAIKINPESTEKEIQIYSGQQISFTSKSISKPGRLTDLDPPWIHNQIIANDLKLGEFIREISRYRKGIVRCDPLVENLRISGVFQTNNTELALSIISETLPVKVSKLTEFFVIVSPKS